MISKFENILNDYKIKVLEEEPTQSAQQPQPSAKPSASDPMQSNDPSSGQGGAVEPEAPNPEDVVDELEKASKKPWVDLAGVLCRAMEYNWTDEDINRINNALPEGLTIRDFIDIRTSPQIRDKYDSNIVSAAVSLFDQVDKMMDKDSLGDVIPAEDR